MRPPSHPDSDRPGAGSQLDPQGFYARLGVAPDATQEAIAHAFRRRALKVHPDVPHTGDKNAFLALRAAYDVLSNPMRRGTYDEAARKPVRPPPAPSFTATHGAHDFRPNVAYAPWLDDDVEELAAPGFTQRPLEASPERSGFPFLLVAVGVGIAGLLCVGVVSAIVDLRAPPRAPGPRIAATAPPVAPQSAAAQRAALYGPEPVRLAGTPNYFVVPGAGAAMLWRQEQDRAQVAPLGELPPFTSVQALRVSHQTGLAEIRYTDTDTAFIDARRLAPGDAGAARNAWCAYNAGPVPSDGEVLLQRSHGGGTLQIGNRAVQPTVVKVRDAAGAVTQSVFLSPNGAAVLRDLPTGPLTADIAVGELWSRACNRFAAGMRARRIVIQLGNDGAAMLLLPPDDRTATDISDQTFEAE